MEQRLNDIDSLIVKYLDNEATYEEKAMLDMWLNFSQENEHYFSRMIKTWEQSHIFLQDESLTEERLARFRQMLFSRKVRRMVYGVSVAAAIALLVFVIRFFMPSPDVILLSDATSDLKKEVVLPDGSVVWLNKNSHIQYPEDFIKRRIVYLTGEAYFDVTHNKKQPFVVETSDFTVKVLGTRFLVTDYSEENIVETVLESGAVEIKTQKTGEMFLLYPGQMFVHDRSMGDTRLEAVEARNFTDWINDCLVFENTRLKDVFIQLEKWYGIHIRCEDTGILQTPVSFTVDAETKEEIFNILQLVVSFTWEQEQAITERSPTITIWPGVG